MKNTLAFALASIALSAPAFAGNVVYEAPAEAVVMAPAPVVPVNDWAGPYVGGQIGYLTGSGSGTIQGEQQEEFDFDIDGSGMLYGVHAGYNFAMGTWIGGVEFDYNRANVDLDIEPAGGRPLREPIPAALDTLSHLKLRGGRAMGPTLFYGTLGLAWASIDIDGEDLSDQGTFIGAGVEQMLTTNISGGVEVLHHRFSNFDGSDVDFNANTISARASYHF